MHKRLLVLLLFMVSTTMSAAVFAEEWIDYDPPLMDDATVDRIRYSPTGNTFDLSVPGFKAVVYEQNAKARIVSQTQKKITLQFQFQGKEGFEYVNLLTPIKIDKPGFRFGGRFKTSVQDIGSIAVRFRDPSGETHQQSFGRPTGEMQYVHVERTPHSWGAWGGDGDKVLQFPCVVESILVDKPGQVPYKADGTLEITDLALYEGKEIAPMLKLQFSSDNPRGLLYDGRGTLRFRLSPVDETLLKDGEKLVVRFEFRQPGDGAAGIEQTAKPGTGRLTSGKAGTPFVDCQSIKIDGTAGGDLFDEGIVLPPQGAVVEMPITAPGAMRVVLFPEIVPQKTSKNRQPGFPVFFSFGAVKPDGPVDKRFGVATHHIWNWHYSDVPNSSYFLHKAGIGMIRDEVYWGNVERNKGEYSFPMKAEGYIGEMVRENIDPLIILTFANDHYDDGGFPVSDEARRGYANYGREIVRHYKDKVKYVEVWNEWATACAMEKHKASKANTPENYVRLLKATSEAIRAENPDVYIVGGGGEHPSYHYEFIEEEFKAGALRYCDAFSVHPYRQPGIPDKTLAEEILRVADLMKQYGCKEPKIWITELGWPTPKSHPADDAELFQAMVLVRSAIPLLATGVVERYFWYNLKNKGVGRVDQEDNFGLLRNDKLGTQIKPAFIAYAVMTRHTADRIVVSDKRLSNEKRNIYAFRLLKEGEPDRLVLWCSADAQSVKLDELPVAACNMFGTPLEIPSDNRWTVSGEPLWISF